MPSRNGNPTLPYLDPEFVPEHPANHPPKPEEYEFYPFQDVSKRASTRREREWMEKAMAEWTPPHVIRSWETNDHHAEQRNLLLSTVLTPKLPLGYEDLGVDDPEINRLVEVIARDERPSFRRFAQNHLRLSEHRFHASHGEPHYPSEEDDPNVPPEDICWIMEYTERECNTIRRQLAHMMGVFPAVTDIENDSYDEEIAWRYDRRLYVRCRRRNTRCIRPEHIIVFTSSFKDLP